MKSGKYFNVRVYALLMNKQNELLIAEEYHYNTFMRKFPGGGLQFGESSIECLRRELKEELNLEVGELKHIHTTDVFVQSAFNKDQQVIGIYFLAEAPEYLTNDFRTQYDQPSIEDEERFRWIDVSLLTEDDFTFQIDKNALKVLKKNMQKLI